MHNTIDNFRPEICILTEENQKYLQFFETGKNYPEKGLGDYIKSDEAIDDLITGDGVPISALVFRAIIDIISERSMDFAGIKAVYLNSLESAESFYIKNDMLYAEDYMVSYAGEDKDLTVMYKFIRDVQMIHEEV